MLSMPFCTLPVPLWLEVVVVEVKLDAYYDVQVIQFRTTVERVLGSTFSQI